MGKVKKWISLLLVVLLIISSIIGCSRDKLLEENQIELEVEDTEESQNTVEDGKDEKVEDVKEDIDENGYYTSKEDVSLYIYTYEKLPNNYMQKKEANNQGWESSKGNLWDVTEKKSIGGDKFGNREKLLPIKKGRQYYECDINYQGGYRGAERLVYSNDGLIYYTEDHYDSFTILYGDE